MTTSQKLAQAKALIADGMNKLEKAYDIISELQEEESVKEPIEDTF